MKKSLFSLALISSSLLAVQAATVQIDFGRDDAATDGALNMNYDHSSAALGTMPGDVTLGWSTAGYPVGDDGHTTTKTPGEENGWKNAFGGSMPFSLGDSFRDGLLTQTATGSGSFTVTFSGLAAGEYTLSLFGGFTGKDVFAGQTWTIGGADASNATWTNFGTNASGDWNELSTTTGDSSGVLAPGNAADGSNPSAIKGLYSTVEHIVVGEDGTLTLTIQGDGSSNFGRTALNYLSLTQVPEPATATLSLLGLAALCLRRRRA